MQTNYFPTRSADISLWQENFRTKIEAIAITIGISESEVAEALAAIEAHQTAYQQSVRLRAEAAAATKGNELQWKKAQRIIRRLVRQVKSSKGYTKAMGHELGVVKVNSNSRQASDFPSLSLVQDGGVIYVKFKKRGYNGVSLYCKRGNEEEFNFLTTKTTSPWADSRPNLVAGQPEKREYYAYYLNKDEQAGSPSPVISITV